MNRSGTYRKRKPAAVGLRNGWNDGDDRFEAADGRREQLLGALRECYGITSREAEHRFREFEDDTQGSFEQELDPLSRLRRVLAH